MINIISGYTRLEKNLEWFQLSGLCILLVYLIGSKIDICGFWWTDESRPAMDGVYLLDILKDLPFAYSDLFEH